MILFPAIDLKDGKCVRLKLGDMATATVYNEDPAAQARFAAGLVDLRAREGLYQQDEHGVQLREQVLYQARIRLPSSVQTGTYTAETFAITRGRVIASAVSKVEVRKLGFERFIAASADSQPFLYGLIAVTLSLAMGWLAGRLFALV